MMPFSVILGMFPVKSLQRTAGPPFTLPPRREGTLPPVSSRRATDRTGGGGAVICTTKYPKAQILPHISGRDVTSGPAPQETHGRFGARPRRRRGGRPGPRTPPQPLRPAFPGPLSRSGPEFPGRRPPPLSRPSGGCHDNANGTAANPHLPLPPFGIPAPVSRGPAPLPSRCA